MSILWRKASRDLWQERTRTFLVVLSIALGVAAFDSVMSAYAVLTRELDRGYLATNPASMIVRADSIDESLVNSVLAVHGVAEAEPRRVVHEQIKSGAMQWRNLTLFVVKDYGDIRINKLQPEAGAWPPATGEILIERDAFQVAKARIGDSVIIKMANGDEHTLRVSGAVHDVGQAQARMENIVYGYITLATLQQLGEQPYLDQLNVLVSRNRFDEPHIHAVADAVKSAIEGSGHEVRRIDFPPPGKHPHSDLMGMLLLAMSTFGLFILGLSGILVVNLLTAIMAGQVRQVGMMKAVGGSRLQICRVYLGQAFLLGVVATVVAVPLGIIGGRLLCRYLATFLNFDITSFAVPLWIYMLVALTGIISPLLSAVIPVWRGTSISVRAAFADFGAGQTRFGDSYFDRFISTLSGGSRLVLLSLRNSFRRRARLALTLITLTAGGLFFMCALNIRASMISTLDHLFSAKKFDLSVFFNGPQPLEQLQAAIRNTPGITASEGWFTTEGSLLKQSRSVDSSKLGSPHGKSQDNKSFTVMGLPANTKMVQMEMISGRPLLPSDTDAIVVNNSLAGDELKVGDPISLSIEDAVVSMTVVGITREAFSPAVAYVPLGYFSARYPGMVNGLRLALEKTDEDSIDRVKVSLDRNLSQAGLRARGSLSKADSRYGFDQHMLMIYLFLIIASVIICGVGTLGLATTMSLNVLERRREMAIMRAIGATPRTIWLIVIVEGMVIGLLSWTVAAALAWPLSKILGNGIVNMLFTNGLNFRFEWIGLLVWLGVTLLASAVATIVPAWKASRTTIRDGLAYQ